MRYRTTSRVGVEKSLAKRERAHGAGRQPVYAVDALESRLLLAAASFGPAVVTPMPQGFQLAGVITPFNDYGAVHDHAIALSATGGGLYLASRPDGGFDVEQTLSTTGTIIGFDAETNGIAYVPLVYTTAGPMFQQPDGTFSAPSGPALPADYVPQTPIVVFYANQTYGSVLFERFVPNAPGAATGTLKLAMMPLVMNGTSGQYGAEADTVIATGVANPGRGSPIPTGVASGPTPVPLAVAAAGRIWLGQVDRTFQPGPLLNLPDGAQNASLYGAPFNRQQLRRPDCLSVSPARRDGQ